MEHEPCRACLPTLLADDTFDRYLHVAYALPLDELAHSPPNYCRFDCRSLSAGFFVATQSPRNAPCTGCEDAPWLGVAFPYRSSLVMRCSQALSRVSVCSRTRLGRTKDLRQIRRSGHTGGASAKPIPSSPTAIPTSRAATRFLRNH